MPALAGFWSGGFEGADHVNAAGVPLDLARASGHLHRLEEDHVRAAAAGLACVRESIGWRLSENAQGGIDLRRMERIAVSAHRHGLQVLWTLMHYGVPDGLSLHDDALIDRFARFAAQVARLLGDLCDRAPVVTPINEIGFLAWAASQPHLLGAPHHTVGFDEDGVRRRGYDVKCRLVRAALQAMDAMKAVDSRCVFMLAEPLVHIVAPPDRPELADIARAVSGWQWQAWDLLTGAERPELGGHVDSVDLVGVNHYHDSQWELGTGRRLDWHARDARRQPLSVLLQRAWEHCRKPLVLAETSHVGSGRGPWLHEMAGEVRLACEHGVPVQGFCLYPLVDRPDWNLAGHWHRSGLWHVAQDEPGLPRAEAGDVGRALHEWQQHLPIGPRRQLPVLVVLCHRPWGTLGHRTQHLVQALADRWRVLWVDPRGETDSPARPAWRTAGPTIDVLSAPDHGGWLADHLLARAGAVVDTVWLTHTAALPVARALRPRRCVVDAATGRAAQTLHEADLVWAEGAAQTRALAARGCSNVHTIPNGIHARWLAHHRGAPTDWSAMEARVLQGRLAAPRVGFAGAIDARLDTRLIGQLADARPHWRFVLAGPLSGLRVADLPQRPNIVWLGEQPHELMPALMAGWDIGWLPWCDTPDSAQTNPTQVLEYLACGLAVVAPRIGELEPLAPAGVRLAGQGGGFLACCDEVLALSPAHRAAEQRVARRLLPSRTWRAAAARAHDLMVATDGQAGSRCPEPEGEPFAQMRF